MRYFPPSAERGAQLRAAMAGSLANSVAPAIDELLGVAASDPLVGLVDAGFASHVHYGAYFDLVLGSPLNEALAPDVRLQTARELVANVQAMTEGAEYGGPGTLCFVPGNPPPVSTLSADYYSETEIARLVRWWDIEPGNAMGMAGASAAQCKEARDQIAKAYNVLRQAAPELHAELLEVITAFVIYVQDGTEDTGFGGASAFGLWGAIAINVTSLPNWLVCYQTIVHEAAHNLLFAIAREEPLLTDDPDRTYESPVREDARPLDGIFHAAFVSVREALALDKLLIWNDKTGSLLAEDVRFSEFLLDLSVRAFWECDETLRQRDTLTPLGDAILSECEDYARANFALVEENA